MRAFVILALIAALLGAGIGCGKKAEPETPKVPIFPATR
jgi:hypothetical protein